MEFIGLILAIIMAAIIAGGMLFIAIYLGPKRPSEIKQQPFECGAENVKPMPEIFPAKFYLVAILFVLFDIEVAFFYPWAMSISESGLYGFIIMTVYISILIFGFVYFWKKGGFDWK